MTTKNEITERTLRTRLANASNEVPVAIKQMLEDAANGKDFMVRLGAGLKTEFKSNNNIQLITGGGEFTLHNNAINQLAAKYGISSRELKKYVSGQFGAEKEWQSDVVAYLLNQHGQHAKQERFLMRCVGNEVRGVMSEFYRVYDNEILVTEFLRAAQDAGAQFAGGYYNGLNIWVEMLLPETLSIHTTNNGIVEIAIGARIKNSEFGSASFELRGFMMNAVCSNGLVRESVINNKHIGKKLPAGIEFSSEFFQTNTKREKLLVWDMTRSLFSSDYIRSSLIRVQQASDIKIDVVAEMEKLKDLGLFKDEIEQTQVVLLNNRASDGLQGENTIWKLTQAITAVSRDKSEERRRELEEICGAMLPVSKERTLFVN